MAETREPGAPRLVKKTKSPDAAPNAVATQEQPETKPAYDLDLLASKLPELERKPDERLGFWRVRLAQFVEDELNPHADLEIKNPEKYKPEKLLGGIRQVLNLRLSERKLAAAKSREVQTGTTEAGEPITIKAGSIKILERKPIEGEISEALNELHKEAVAERQKLQDLDQIVEQNIKEIRDNAPAKNKKGYGQQITDLSNKMRREKSRPDKRAQAGLILMDEYDTRILNEPNPRKRQELAQKRQDVEKYLVENLPEEMDKVRAAAELTLNRVPKYKEADQHPLRAETLQESDEKFKELTRTEWAKDLVVHGIVDTNRKGEVFIRSKTDLDGQTALAILREAGIDTRKVKYVAPGAGIPGKINIDTGGGIFDHHDQDTGDETCAAQKVYEAMIGLGLMGKSKAYEKVIEYVTRCDNLAYPPEAYGPKSYNTLVGLRRYMNLGILKKFFRAGQEPMGPIPDETLKQFEILHKRKNWRNNEMLPEKTLYQFSQERLEKCLDAQKMLGEMRKNGLVFNTKDYGQIVVDIGDQLKTGVEAAKASGAGAYIKWVPENNSFFVSTVYKNFPGGLSQGKPVRKKMWIKPRTDAEPLRITLNEVVRAFAGKDFQPTGELEKYLLEEQRQQVRGELIAGLVADGVTPEELAEWLKDPEFYAQWQDRIENIAKKRSNQ